MLEVFVLGFWLIWSSERDMSALMESFSFTGLAILIRSMMAFEAPDVNQIFFADMALQWAFVAFVMWAVNRFSTNFSTTLFYTLIGAGGYYWLTLNSRDLVEKLFV